MNFKLLMILLLGIFLSGCQEDTYTIALKQYKNRDFQDAILSFQKACVEGNTKSCRVLVLLYAKGKDTLPQSQAKALKAMELGCQVGDRSLCHLAYRAYEKLGLEYKLTKIATQGCNGGDANFCLTLASQAYQQGNFEESLQKAQKACFGGSKNGCELSVILYEDIFQDLQKAEFYRQKAEEL